MLSPAVDQYPRLNLSPQKQKEKTLGAIALQVEALRNCEVPLSQNFFLSIYGLEPTGTDQVFGSPSPTYRACVLKRRRFTVRRAERLTESSSFIPFHFGLLLVLVCWRCRWRPPFMCFFNFGRMRSRLPGTVHGTKFLCCSVVIPKNE
jgi:hypothetical protein